MVGVTSSQEGVLGVLQGKKMEALGTGKELFFVFTDQRLLVLDPGFVELLLAGASPPSTWQKRRLEFQEHLEKMTAEEISRKSKEAGVREEEFFYQDIKRFEVFRRFLTTRLRVITFDQTIEFMLIGTDIRQVRRFFKSLPLPSRV
jgi:hypothetical protein